jgi:hypothetical protein
VEAEHTTNVGKMRAFDDAPLPSLERARSAIKCKSSLNVLKDTYDHSCC